MFYFLLCILLGSYNYSNDNGSQTVCGGLYMSVAFNWYLVGDPKQSSWSLLDCLSHRMFVSTIKVNLHSQWVYYRSLKSFTACVSLCVEVNIIKTVCTVCHILKPSDYNNLHYTIALCVFFFFLLLPFVAANYHNKVKIRKCSVCNKSVIVDHDINNRRKGASKPQKHVNYHIIKR